MAKLSALEKRALNKMSEIVEATKSEQGFVFADPFEVSYLVERGLIEQNPEITNGDELATRATQKGVDFVTNLVQGKATGSETKENQEQNKPAETGTQGEKVKMSFEIESGVFAKPATKRGGAGNSKYALEKLEVGQSIFIPGKEAKQLGGTVSAANKRFAVEVVGETRVNKKGVTVPVTKQDRKFEVYDCEKDTVKGARIGRTL